MADTTSTAPTWLTTAEAAARLNVSTRTVARRIAAGELSTQRTPDGRVLVAVDARSMPAEAQALTAVQATAEGSRQAALALADALPAMQRAYEAAALAASRAVEQADARVSAAERNASWWRMACLTACLPAVMAVAALSWTRAGVGHAADTVSDTPETPMAARVTAPVVVEADPDGWHPPLQP
jgi:excisionase family DNA binding protein